MTRRKPLPTAPSPGPAAEQPTKSSYIDRLTDSARANPLVATVILAAGVLGFATALIQNAATVAEWARHGLERAGLVAARSPFKIELSLSPPHADSSVIIRVALVNTTEKPHVVRCVGLHFMDAQGGAMNWRLSPAGDSLSAIQPEEERVYSLTALGKDLGYALGGEYRSALLAVQSNLTPHFLSADLMPRLVGSAGTGGMWRVDLQPVSPKSLQINPYCDQ
jgi:hypothetical protein